MKHIGIIIFILSIFLGSCQKEDFTQSLMLDNFSGNYEFEETRYYPNTGKEIAIKNKVELTLKPNYGNDNQIWIEEYGIYAIVENNQLNIPFQTDIAGQFSYVGYGFKNDNQIELYLNIQNHTAKVTQTTTLKSINETPVLN